MMKMKKILLLTAMLLCLCSCETGNAPAPTASSNPPESTQKADLKKIEISAENKFEGLNTYEDCVYDITNSGDENETIILATSAQKDGDGDFMWDDSQQWALYVKNADGVYPLYENSLHGNLTLNVSEHYLESGATEPVVRLTISASAGFEIREYKFSDGVFTEEIAYNTGAINELSVNRYY